MRKSNWLILAALLMMSFSSNSDKAKFVDTEGITLAYCYKYEVIDGMKYLIIRGVDGGVATTNITKDYLECEKLKIEISKLKNTK